LRNLTFKPASPDFRGPIGLQFSSNLPLADI
jgi:hypothetical protein